MTKLSDQEAEVRALDDAIRRALVSLNALKQAMRKVDVAHQHALALGGAVAAYTFADDKLKAAQQAVSAARAKLKVKRAARNKALEELRRRAL